MNNRGFTLTELLAVIVIIGVVTSISIPLIGNLINNDSGKYEYFEAMVKEAMLLYEEKYLPKIPDEKKCININYNELVRTSLLKEESFKCNGRIIGRRNKNTGFSYEYYLNCTNDKNNQVVKNLANMPNLSDCYVKN